MHHYFTPKKVSITDSLIHLTGALLYQKLPKTHHISIVKHIRDMLPLLEFRLVCDTYPQAKLYGIRQVWVLADPEMRQYEVSFTTLDHYQRFTNRYPNVDHVSSLVFEAIKEPPLRYEIERIYELADLLADFLATDWGRTALPNQEADLAHKDA